MKILQLNVWTGRIKGTLIDFIKKGNYDVVCLQEAIWSDSPVLDNFCVSVEQIIDAGGFEHDLRGANMEIDAFGTKVMQGNVILSRSEIEESRVENIRGVYRPIRTLDDVANQRYTLLIAKLANGVNIVTHHGYWRPDPYGDKETIASIHKVAGFVKDLAGPIVMCGDLNVVYASPAMRELDFLRDLTDEYNIRNTLMGLKFSGEVACDHILVNDQIEVRNFKALDNLVSDHKALEVEIS